MKFVMASLFALAVLFFVFRSGPIAEQKQRSEDVSQAVDAPEQATRKNYLKSPIDRTKAVLGKVKVNRDDSRF